MILAQLQNVPPQTAAHITAYLIGLLGVLALIAGPTIGWLSYRHNVQRDSKVQAREVQPQPLQVQGVPNSDERCAKMHEPLRGQIIALSESLNKREEYAADRREKIYRRLEILERSQATGDVILRGEVRQDIANLDAKVNSLAVGLGALTQANETESNRLTVIEADIKTLLKRI